MRVYNASSTVANCALDNEELLLKLDQEIKQESDMSGEPSGAERDLQKHIKAMESKGWEIVDTPGEQEVAMVKKRDDETYSSILSPFK